MSVTNERKSSVEPGKLYFWTATINNWYKLLNDDALKDVIVSSLKYLSKKKKIEVYAFVIMPNHVHFMADVRNEWQRNATCFLFKIYCSCF